MAKKQCSNLSCPMGGREVETSQPDCLSCGRALQSVNPLGVLGDMLGSKNPFGSGLPPDVTNLLVDVEVLLERLIAGGTAKKSELRAIVTRARSIRGEHG